MKEAVAYVTAHHGYSEHRACALTRQHRSTQRKPSIRESDVHRPIEEFLSVSSFGMSLTSHAGNRTLSVICKNLGHPPNIYPAIGRASSKRLAPPNVMPFAIERMTN